MIYHRELALIFNGHVLGRILYQNVVERFTTGLMIQSWLSLSFVMSLFFQRFISRYSQSAYTLLLILILVLLNRLQFELLECQFYLSFAILH